MSFNFNEAVKGAEEKYGVGSNSKTEWLTKFIEGDTRLRLLSHTVAYAQHYIVGGYMGVCLGKDRGCPGCAVSDKPKLKWLGWVLHEEQIKPCLLPHTIVVELGNYQADPEYAFTEPPMPYDITITKKKTGEKEQNVKYSIKASRINAPVSEEIMAELAKKLSPDQLKDKMREKKAIELGIKPNVEPDQPTGVIEYPEEEINPEDIPY